MTGDWLELGDDIPPEEHEEARRWVEQEMDERYAGCAARPRRRKSASSSHFIEDLTASVPAETAHREQEIAFSKEVVAFSNAVLENVENAEKYGRPLSREMRATVFVATAEGYFDGFTSLAVNVCAALGYNLTNYEAAEDRVFRDGTDG